MEIEAAWKEIKCGNQIFRAGWAVRGMFRLYVSSAKDGIIEKIGTGDLHESLFSWFGVKTPDGKFAPLAVSQADFSKGVEWEV